VRELYSRRADAFGGAPERLADVYTAGSPLLAADEQHARELEAAGEQLSGFAPVVGRVSVVSAAGDRAELQLTDSWPAYRVVPAGRAGGPALRTVPGRPDAEVRLVLLRTPEGWRIDRAERTG